VNNFFVRAFIFVFLFDQVSKIFVRTLRLPWHAESKIFFLPLNPSLTWVVLGICATAVLFLLWRWQQLFSGAAGLMAAGVASNILERLWRGAITDIFLLPGGWALNLADFALLTGAALIIWRREEG
jgi:lipoprotein signal peptidase